ncbi:gliding motility-associated C-terminal domain-containing protein [Chitinophaga sp. CF118]|uniref:gliding motility-associated C-terminal domain-containing protein n=1 Tax=Chitinophaga sp. CF118 TaxID=1884367 RepID=UPI0008EFA7D6|nr:gliding motility-associated C-terminal domain-containing protein [Chitinophaga sp. CF118]SFD58012.1 gliding motility-associated C-terminal domain-containing protein [Chitinophaga sp. CF118]
MPKFYPVILVLLLSNFKGVAQHTPCGITVTTIPDAFMCQGSSIQMDATGGVKYSWSPAAGLSNDSIANPVARPDTTTTYTVTAYNAIGCSGTATVTIRVNPLPVITKNNDTSICVGDHIQLSIGTNYPATYSWSPATGLDNPYSANPLASPVKNTSYTVTATTTFRCISKTSINLTVNPAPEFIIRPDTPVLCIGQHVLVKASGGDEYAWYVNNDSLISISDALTIAPTTDTLYKLKITNNTCHYTDSFQVPVKVYKIPVTSLTRSNNLDCTHHEAKLLATGGIKYKWETAEGLSDMNIANPVVKPIKTTTYQVTITDEHGCSNLEAMTMNVDFGSSLSQYPMPSAFTPNGDGKNDCFGLKYWERVPGLEFNIFNRSGQLLFSTNSPYVCWDGNYKGMPQPVGTYMYSITAKTTCGKECKKGMVMLLR